MYKFVDQTIIFKVQSNIFVITNTFKYQLSYVSIWSWRFEPNINMFIGN